MTTPGLLASQIANRGETLSIDDVRRIIARSCPARAIMLERSFFSSYQTPRAPHLWDSCFRSFLLY